MSDIKKPLQDQKADIEEMFAENNDLQNPSEKVKRTGAKLFVTVILILVLIFVVLLVVSKFTDVNILGLSKSDQAETSAPAKASDWQAVFLTNGQVYFGKLKGENSNYPTLEDVYYLQVQEVPIQPAQAASNEEGVQEAQQTQQQMILVKFGTEMHRPMDKMYINKDHVLMYEDLSEESAVVKAIKNYKEENLTTQE